MSEKQLGEGRAAKVKWIVVPQATHVSDATVAALQKLAGSGVRILMVGEHNLEWDQYHRPRTPVDELKRAAKLPTGSDENTSAGNLLGLLGQGGLKIPVLTYAATTNRAWGVEFRMARENGKPLMSLINLSGKPCSVRVPMSRKPMANDLLSGERVAVENVSLEPMVPRLLIEP